MKTPYIIYRVLPALLATYEVDLDSLERSGSLDLSETYRWEKTVYEEDGSINPEFRKAILEHGEAVSARTGISLIVVFGDCDCFNVNPNGLAERIDYIPRLAVIVGNSCERYDLISLPELVRNPYADEQAQRIWFQKISALQVMTVHSFSNDAVAIVSLT